MSKERTALYELITNSKLDQSEESFWVKLLKGVSLTTKYHYLGPGTNLKKNCTVLYSFFLSDLTSN
jgi:hypothetical protein